MKKYTPTYIYTAVAAIVIFSGMGAFAAEAPEYAGGEPRLIELTLDDALQVALTNNFEIQLARYDKAISDADMDDALSIYDTVLEMTGEYTHDELETPSTLAGSVSEDYEGNVNLSKKLRTGTDVDIDYNYARTRTDSAFTQLNPAEESYVKFGFTQPLLKNMFGMNDRGDVRITKIEVDNFDSETLDVIEEALADVELSYWELLLVEEMLVIRRNAEEKAKEFHDIVAHKEEVGSAELTDLYASKANLRVRAAESLLSESNVKTAENKLKLLMNHKVEPSSIRISPADEVEVATENIALVPALKVAFENRRDYKRAMKEITAKDIKLAMKANERWPQLDLEGSFKMNGIRRSLVGSLQDMTDETNTEYYAGVTFSIPLEGRGAKSAYDKAKAEQAKALVELKKIEKTILLEIDSKVKAVNVQRQRVKEFFEAVEFQQQKMQEELKKYRYGRSDADRVTRFQQDYLDAELSLRLAERAYVKELVELYLDQNIYLAERSLTVE